MGPTGDRTVERDSVDDVLNDAKLARVSAVKNKRSIPCPRPVGTTPRRERFLHRMVGKQAVS